MEAAALPAARMSKRPAGAAGRCGRKQPSGCAAATAVRNSDSRKARGDAIKIRPRARRDAQPEVRGAVNAWKIAEPVLGRTCICGVVGRTPRWKACRFVTIVMALGSRALRSPAKGRSYGARRQDPHRARGSRVSALGRTFAHAHRRAEPRPDEPRRLLPQLPVQLD